MKRRWRRIIVTLVGILATVGVLGSGSCFWLYRSGVQAALTRELQRRLVDRGVTSAQVEESTWTTLTLIDARFQQQVAGWNVTVVCPRLEAHYGVTGLITKRLETLHLHRPRVVLTQRSNSHPDASDSPPIHRILTALPSGRVHVRQGRLEVHGHQRHYVLQPLDAILQQHDDRTVHLEATVPPAAHPSGRGRGHMSPTDRIRLAAAASSSQLADILAPMLSVPWRLEHGQLDSQARFDIKQQTLHGEVRLSVKRLQVQGENLRLHDAAFDTTFSLEANLQQSAIRLDGSMTLQAARAQLPAATAASGIALSASWRLAATGDGWKLAATPDIRLQTAAFGAAVQVSGLTTSGPVEVLSTERDPQFSATLEVEIQRMRFHTDISEPPRLQITGLQGRIPIRGSLTALTVSNATMRTHAWQRSAANGPEVVPSLTLRGSGSIDLGQQHLTLQDIMMTVPQLGSLSGTGTWQWSAQTGRELQVQITPTDLRALMERLEPLLPVPLRTWHLAGKASLQVRASRLRLREPRLLHGMDLSWRFHDAALSTPDGSFASEHLNGSLETTATFDGASGQSTLQGTLTLQPFALLVGRLFPALEDNRITSVVTYSGTYETAADRLKLYLAGQFSHLGVVKLEGEVQQPLGTPQYDLQARLYAEQVGRLWHTLVSDPVQFPTLSAATVQGQLDSRLQIRGRGSEVTLRGSLDLTDLTFRSDAADISGVTLRLPVQLHHPLPLAAPEGRSLPPSAYGPLHVASMRIGSVEFGELQTGLVLRSDTLLFQHAVQLTALGGSLRFERLVAEHLLRPERRIAMRVLLHELDLRQLGRDPASLPLAGRLNGDLARLQIHADRLETQGALTVEVAGGLVRIDGVHGSHLFTAIPTLRASLVTDVPLSLSRLTQIYPIGGMGGSLHFSLTDLELTAWEPEAFVLDFAVQSPGGEKREITLRALNNLLFTTGSVKVATSLLGETYRLPYKRFGATLTLHNDILEVRGKYHDRAGTEYIMQAPALGGGVSIVNRVPKNGMSFQDFVQRLKATVLEKPDVQVK